MCKFKKELIFNTVYGTSYTPSKFDIIFNVIIYYIRFNNDVNNAITKNNIIGDHNYVYKYTYK
jgi:hypothetical protein